MRASLVQLGRKNVGLGKQQVLISVVVCRSKARERDAAAQGIGLIVEQVTRRELVVVTDLMINAQERSDARDRLRDGKSAGAKLNVARSSDNLAERQWQCFVEPIRRRHFW